MRGHHGPDCRRLHEGAVRDLGALLGLLLLHHLLDHLIVDRRGELGGAEEGPDRAPHETQSREDIEYARPARALDQGPADEQPKGVPQLHASEDCGHRSGPQLLWDVGRKEVRHRRWSEPLPEPDYQPTQSERHDPQARYQGGHRGAQGPRQDGQNEHRPPPELRRHESRRNLRESVPPEERRGDQALVRGAPAELLRQRDDRHRHVHLVQVAEHERHRKQGDQGPHELVVALRHLHLVDRRRPQLDRLRGPASRLERDLHFSDNSSTVLVVAAVDRSLGLPTDLLLDLGLLRVPQARDPQAPSAPAFRLPLARPAPSRPSHHHHRSRRSSQAQAARRPQATRLLPR
mmetsp:Transcript_9061/g.25791  ORF Transcript_9061/g.25791 Transcript_9061/m.25791 type:complete len:347 (-) Transcript_9061:248-1288(-)